MTSQKDDCLHCAISQLIRLRPPLDHEQIIFNLVSVIEDVICSHSTVEERTTLYDLAHNALVKAVFRDAERTARDKLEGFDPSIIDEILNGTGNEPQRIVRT